MSWPARAGRRGPRRPYRRGGGGRGAGRSAAAPAATVPTGPSLVATGIKLGPPSLGDLPSAGTSGHIDIPFTSKDRKAPPKGLEASARWDPINVPTVPTDPASAPDPTSATTPPASTP